MIAIIILMKISQLFKIYQDLLNSNISIKGWIQTARTQKNDILANDILYLCRSLGFAAYNKKCEKRMYYFLYLIVIFKIKLYGNYVVK